MDYEVATIKRQTKTAYGWFVVGQSVAYKLYARSVCDDSALEMI